MIDIYDEVGYIGNVLQNGFSSKWQRDATLLIRILDLQGRLDERNKEVDDLHSRVRRLKDRVHELETRESVKELVDESSTSLAIRKHGGLLAEIIDELDKL